MKRNSILVLIALFIVIIVGVVFYLRGNSQNTLLSTQQNYKISSLIDYDANLCSGIGYAYKQNGFNSGIKLIFKDKITGELIEGSAMTSTSESESSIDSKNYSCEESINSEEVLISANAQGYTPSVFIFKYPKNKLAIVEVLMMKSCSGGPSFFDNLDLSAKFIASQSISNEYIKNSQNRFYEIIEDQFNLKKSDYSVECAEGDLGRRGYVKVKGEYKDGSPLELNYHLGWCSSGGSDCGWSMCLKSQSDDLFGPVKNNFCNKLSSRQLYDDYSCTSQQAHDKTEEVKGNCIAGEFENIDGNTKSISIIQNSNRCTDSVKVGEFNCIES